MTTEKLNALLGRELGWVRNTDEPVYKWEWSDDLFWPAFQTGGRVENTSPGGIVYFEKEYKREHQSFKLKKQWVITHWSPPEKLTEWQRTFPGAPYPADGYRIFTDWSNPPGMLPTLADTEDCIRCVKEATSMTYAARLADMEAEAERTEKGKESQLYAMVRNEFTAFLNEAPGKRGNSISMPWTKEDRI